MTAERILRNERRKRCFLIQAKRPTPSNLRANRAKSALTAVLFLSFALVSAVLMRGHASLKIDKPDPDLPGNGGNNHQGTSDYKITLTPQNNWEFWIPGTGTGDSTYKETITFTAKTNATPPTGSVTFELSEVTNHQGRYMNDSNASYLKDLTFSPTQSDDFTWSKSKYDYAKQVATITATWNNPNRDGDGAFKIPASKK